ncbi:alpha/beta fold hydrolase [Serratia symbiotica]|uniref:alpha/beta fold hydrolase n=1 Tax=Serratia symbiotica TaxID=138074 RepID=UPI003D9A8333
MPVLLIHGQNDCVINEATFHQLRRIPQAAELIVKGHGHFIPLTTSRFFLIRNYSAFSMYARFYDKHPDVEFSRYLFGYLY